VIFLIKKENTTMEQFINMLNNNFIETITILIMIGIIIKIIEIYIIWLFLKSSVKSATYEAIIDAYNTIQEHNEKTKTSEEWKYLK
jgi:hypothetical protein